MKQKGFAPVLIILIILLALIVIPIIGSKLFPIKMGQIIVSTPLPSTSPSATSSASVGWPYKNHAENVFTSQKLGISFKYLTGWLVGEKDNIVYINNEKPLEKGQWVEVVYKNSSDSLTDAIQKIILPGYSGELCHLETIQYFDPYDANFLKKGYTFARIIADQKEIDAVFMGQKSRCPEVYTVYNSKKYFMMDPKHPNKFFFFSIGQHNIPAGTGPWQETFTVTN